MCREQGVIAVHETIYETVHLIKFIGIKVAQFFFRVIMLRYLVLQDIKY